MKQYDAIIIGFGKGGKTIAGKMAKLGKRVAIIEKSAQMYGGTCINEGCIPSKSLITQAEKYNYHDAIINKEDLITKLRNKNYAKLADLQNVDVITATAKFVDDHHVAICTENEEEIIFGDLIFVNTGATPVMPPIKGLATANKVYTSASLMKLEELPKTLAIIGGGYIGLEFASMYARYGSEVTVYESNVRLIAREDRDIAEEIQRILEKQGVKFVFNANIQALANEGEEVLVTYNDQVSQRFAGILMATGRKANTADLNLDAAGIEVNQRGEIVVNKYLQTTKKNIFALGDVKGGLQFTYISLDDSRIVMDYLFGDKKRSTLNRGNIAYSVFISPTFSRIGLSEVEAKAAGYEVIVTKLLTAAVPKANVLKKPEGLLKAIIDKKTERILGCVLLCEHSEELINLVTLVMNNDLSYKVLKNQIFTHPTMAEALNDLFDL